MTLSLDEVQARARGQLGYVESGGPDGHSGNIVKYWPDDGWSQYQGESWCAAFVTWLFLPDPTDWVRYLECNQGERIFQSHGAFFTDPRMIKKGDVLFYHWPGDVAGANHTGIASSDARDDMTVTAIEGNTSSGTAGSQTNGGGVYERVRPFSLIHGIGRPSYGAPLPPPVVEPQIPNGVGFMAHPSTRGGWVYASDGGVFTVGGIPFFGSLGGQHLNAPIVAGVSAASGYWLAAADGGVFSFGAGFYGSAGGSPLNQPIVAMIRTPTSKGYWLIAADGGVFSYGDAGFYGSAGGTKLNAPIIHAAATPSGKGYWLLGRDGGIFAYGDAPFRGSLTDVHLNAPIVALLGSPAGQGYVAVGADGGVFRFGDCAGVAMYDKLPAEYEAGARKIIGADWASGANPNDRTSWHLMMVSDKLETYVP